MKFREIVPAIIALVTASNFAHAGPLGGGSPSPDDLRARLQAIQQQQKPGAAAVPGPATEAPQGQSGELPFLTVPPANQPAQQFNNAGAMRIQMVNSVSQHFRLAEKAGDLSRALGRVDSAQGPYVNVIGFVQKDKPNKWNAFACTGEVRTEKVDCAPLDPALAKRMAQSQHPDIMNAAQQNVAVAVVAPKAPVSLINMLRQR